jgi:hypothetical protein
MMSSCLGLVRVWRLCRWLLAELFSQAGQLRFQCQSGLPFRFDLLSELFGLLLCNFGLFLGLFGVELGDLGLVAGGTDQLLGVAAGLALGLQTAEQFGG